MESTSAVDGWRVHSDVTTRLLFVSSTVLRINACITELTTEEA
jgi:hypothetical protein